VLYRMAHNNLGIDVARRCKTIPVTKAQLPGEKWAVYLALVNQYPDVVSRLTRMKKVHEDFLHPISAD
jgi:hypothetical protein